MAYALKVDGRAVPFTGMIDPEVLINGGRNTIVFERIERSRTASSRSSPRIIRRSQERARCAICSVACPVEASRDSATKTFSG